MTRGLLISRNTKNILHKNYLINQNNDNLNKYKIYQNLYNALIKQSKKLTINNKLAQSKNNPKKTWSIYNELTKGIKSTDNINEITTQDGTVTDKKLIAEEFNKFFSTIGKKISDTIPLTKNSPDIFIQPKSDTPLLEFLPIGCIEICDILKTFEPKVSSDIFGVNMKLLKFVGTSISQPLAHVFSSSLGTGIFPEKLKCSKVIPIFKAGDKKICNNYRPISLVNSFAKIIEKIVAIRLTNHLQINKLISDAQFGFQRGLSTEHNILHLTNYISEALNENKFCIGIFLDLQKAFDVVPHDILIKKTLSSGSKRIHITVV